MSYSGVITAGFNKIGIINKDNKSLMFFQNIEVRLSAEIIDIDTVNRLNLIPTTEKNVFIYSTGLLSLVDWLSITVNLVEILCGATKECKVGYAIYKPYISDSVISDIKVRDYMCDIVTYVAFKFLQQKGLESNIHYIKNIKEIDYSKIVWDSTKSTLVVDYTKTNIPCISSKTYVLGESNIDNFLFTFDVINGRLHFILESIWFKNISESKNTLDIIKRKVQNIPGLDAEVFKSVEGTDIWITFKKGISIHRLTRLWVALFGDEVPLEYAEVQLRTGIHGGIIDTKLADGSYTRLFNSNKNNLASIPFYSVVTEINKNAEDYYYLFFYYSKIIEYTALKVNSGAYCINSIVFSLAECFRGHNYSSKFLEGQMQLLVDKGICDGYLILDSSTAKIIFNSPLNLNRCYDLFMNMFDIDSIDTEEHIYAPITILSDNKEKIKLDILFSIILHKLMWVDVDFNDVVRVQDSVTIDRVRRKLKNIKPDNIFVNTYISGSVTYDITYNFKTINTLLSEEDMFDIEVYASMYGCTLGEVCGGNSVGFMCKNIKYLKELLNSLGCGIKNINKFNIVILDKIGEWKFYYARGSVIYQILDFDEESEVMLDVSKVEKILKKVKETKSDTFKI